MSNPDLAYRIARVPIDLAFQTGQLAVWPIHFGKTLATNLTDTAFKILGTSTEDEPLENVEGESIYDLADYSLNVASLIYYYTELRSEIKKATWAYATQKGMNGGLSQLLTLKNAIDKVKEALDDLKEDPEKTDGTANVKKYRDALDQLNRLAKEYNLETGELDVFQTVSRVWLSKC